MTTRKNLVKVSILGEEYPLRSDMTPEHVRTVARFVDEAVRRVLNGGVVETHKAAVLAALEITDELFRARAALDDATGGVRQLSDEVRRMLPPQKRGLSTPAERSRRDARDDARGEPEPFGDDSAQSG